MGYPVNQTHSAFIYPTVMFYPKNFSVSRNVIFRSLERLQLNLVTPFYTPNKPLQLTLIDISKIIMILIQNMNKSYLSLNETWLNFTPIIKRVRQQYQSTVNNLKGQSKTNI